MFYYTEYQSPVGVLTVASDGIGIVGLWLEGQKYFLDTIPEQPIINNELDVFYRAKDWLDRYFMGKSPQSSELPLRPFGSSFRQTVWKHLCDIPYGEVATYGDIAKKVARYLGREKMSAQAIGGAVGRNPISIIIPCHRVVGVGGELVGYAGGIDKKLRLLQLEGVDANKLRFR